MQLNPNSKANSISAIMQFLRNFQRGKDSVQLRMLVQNVTGNE